MKSSLKPLYDAVVIGGGPAGIAAALGLEKTFSNILIIEAGRSYRKRICPVDRQKKCYGCNNICNVISGFGGCIHYGDGIKLSKFPSGRRLFEKIGEDRSLKLSDSALEMISSESSLNFLSPKVNNSVFNLKNYKIGTLREIDVKKTISDLYYRINISERITLVQESKVFRLKKNGELYNVSYSMKDTEINVYSTVVVVAVGRFGRNWWKNTVRELNLKYELPSPSVGVRFECPNEYLLDAFNIHNDFKTTIECNNLKTKTFCFCSGEGGGRIKFTDYGEYTLLDGHIAPESGLKTANFALLIQLKNEDGNSVDDNWIQEELIQPYINLRKNRGGKPVIQWYPDFKKNTLTCLSREDYVKLTFCEPSLSDLEFAQLSSIFSKSIHDTFCQVFELLIEQFIAGLDGVSMEHVLNKVGVVGLELENLWDEIEVDQFMESSLKNLFVCGDCNGLAQGILQSFVSGLAAAEKFGKWGY